MSNIPQVGLNNSYVSFQKKNKAQNNMTSEINTHEKKGKGTKALIGAGLLSLAAVGVYLATKKPVKFDKPLSEYTLTQKPAKVKNAGATVQEIIENVFGKSETKIKPHTYDLSKEFDTITTFKNNGGYKSAWATKEGTLQPSQVTSKLCVNGVRERSITNRPTTRGGKVKHFGNKDFDVCVGYVPEYNNKIVSLELPDDAKGNTKIMLNFISPNSKLTPLQRDVLKLAKNADTVSKEAKAKFDSIMEWRLDAWQRQGKSWTTEEMLENYSKYDSLDYDLILSTIQSLAKGIK